MATKTNFPLAGGNARAGGNRFYDFPGSIGNVIFLDSTGTAGSGFSPESPAVTLNAAVALCTANNGDTILACPGHTETLTAAAGAAMTKAGIRLISLGKGRNRAVFNYSTSTAASFDVTAANCYIENVVFRPLGVDAVVAAVNVTAADAQFVNCEFELADATNQAALGILTAATATRMIVDGCHFHGTTDAGTAAAIRHASGNDVIIRNNLFFGAYTTSLGAIDNTAAVTGLQIHNNVIANATASSTKAFVCHGSTTVVFSNNRLGILSGTAPITAAAGTNGGGNYYSAAAGVAAATLL